MPKEALPDGGASPAPGPMGPRRRVSEMQAKLHRWAAADPGRRFDDLFNFVCDPATLIVAFDRVAGNAGSRTAGVSPLLANIALSALDEYLHEPWRPGGPMSTAYLRSRRRVHGLPRWRVVRYADDFVVLVHGDRTHVEALREEITHVLQPIGLRLSESKTTVVHMSDGFDFLGFHIRWKRKRGTNKWHVYTFIADRPIRSLKAKIRALTRRKSQQSPKVVLIRLNQIMRGWANYFKHAACKRTLSSLSHFVWWRVVGWLRRLHRWRWKDVRSRFTGPDGRWRPITADGIALFNLAAVPVTRYRYRYNTIPNPWTLPTAS